MRKRRAKRNAEKSAKPAKPQVIPVTFQDSALPREAMLEMAESSKREAEFIRHLIKVGDWMQLRLMAEHLERDAQAYRAFACPRLFPAPATDEQVRLYVNEECLTPEGIAAPQTN